MDWNEKRWKRSVAEFGRFMEPLVGELGRSERREGASLYVEGLLTPGQRKSVEPMAARLHVDYQKLQQFVTDSPWDDGQVWSAIRREIVPVMEPLEAWITDETGWVKQGNKSVGVAHQYCGAVGKQANCQVSVHVTVTNGEIALPIAGRLYLPESWTSDRDRCAEAGIPESVEFLTKPKIALELIQQALAEGVPKAPVLGDSVYGDAGPLRGALRVQGMEYFFQVEERLLAWTHPVKIERSRKHWRVAEGQPAPLPLRAIAEQILPDQWKLGRWKNAEGEKQTTRIAWLPIYLLSDLDEETGAWPQTLLVVDWPEGKPDPYHCYVAHLHTQPNKVRCLRLSRSRFHVEQYFQRDKDDLGLDHFEGRSWRGFHHHLVLAAAAYIFVLLAYLESKKQFWIYVGGSITSDSAVVRAVNRLLSALPHEI
ncbi:MAG: IS701 family transposase [Acidobacteriota bacterium]